MSDTAEQPTTEAPVPKWGDPISPKRQAQLQRYTNAWDALVADHGGHQGPFDGVMLTGADVFWLAELSGRGESGEVPNLHLEGVNLFTAHVEGANLIRAHLEGAYLDNAQLQHATLFQAQLEGAYLGRANLQDAMLNEAKLEGANLSEAQLDIYGWSLSSRMWGRTGGRGRTCTTILLTG